MACRRSLIRYRFVIHGAIDGFSRLITYLHCADNNKAETVLTQFMKASEVWCALPSSDRLCMVAKMWEFGYILEEKGEDRTLRVHNTRIERLWRDVHENVVSF